MITNYIKSLWSNIFGDKEFYECQFNSLIDSRYIYAWQTDHKTFLNMAFIPFNHHAPKELKLKEFISHPFVEKCEIIDYSYRDGAFILLERSEDKSILIRTTIRTLPNNKFFSDYSCIFRFSNKIEYLLYKYWLLRKAKFTFSKYLS